MKQTSSPIHLSLPEKNCRAKKFTITTFCVVNFFLGSLYSVIAPFFPTEATRKGVSGTLIGFIFAAFELTIVFTSPIYGTFINRIGAKVTYISGILVCGVAVAIFGILDRIEDRTTFIVMCFVVRCIEALGVSAFNTSSFAIIAHTFPDKVATMLGTLESFSAVGLMVGAPIGGALYELGGFILPFVTLGSALLLIGFMSIFLLPSAGDVERPMSDRSIFSLFRIPVVSIVGICIVCTSMIIGYRHVSLSVFLSDSFHLSPVWVGSVFLAGSASYALMALVWGYIGDKQPKLNNIIISVGSLIGGLSLYLMGPAPFFHFKCTLWLVYVTMISLSVGLSTQVISFKVVTEKTMAAGHVDCLATYGLIAGFINSLISCGASFGPMVGGFLDENLGFELASVAIGSCSLLASFTLFVFTLVSSRLGSHSCHELGDLENKEDVEVVGIPKFFPVVNDSSDSDDSDDSDESE